jgi:sugar phosphate isomerase/epimerase
MSDCGSIIREYPLNIGKTFGSNGQSSRNIFVFSKHLQWLGFRYDIRHAVVEGTRSWPVTLKAIAAYIRSLDIKNFEWINESDNPIHNTPVGEGIIDFKKYIELLTEYDIHENMTMHFEYPLGGAETGKKELTVNPEVVINAMKKDLMILKGYLKP